jgi:ATP-dependent Clp protease ATP-binding subunit ClpA
MKMIFRQMIRKFAHKNALHLFSTAVMSPASIKLGTFLTKFGTNLTKIAAEGKLDPVFGRDNEIARAIQVLSRRKKNNPCFIGEPGVGKTAIGRNVIQ